MRACWRGTLLLLPPASRSVRTMCSAPPIDATSGLSCGWGGAAQLWRSNLLRRDDASAAAHHAALLATVQGAFAEFTESSRRKRRQGGCNALNPFSFDDRDDGRELQLGTNPGQRADQLLTHLV